VDLSADGDAAETDALVRLLFLDEAPEEREDRLAVRGERVFAARMLPCPMPKVDAKPQALGVDQEFRVETGRGGSFETLPLRVMELPVPGPGEVAIAVDFVALNFIDVTKAAGFSFGLDPKAPIEMGGECSGRVAALGEGVQGLSVGDEVVALTTSPLKKGLLASTVILPAPLVLPKPAGLSQIEGAGLPIAYLTAYYSLIELGRMRRGEWVLIHAGAGGVGLAAVRIAQAAGARIIATASSPEKHAFLHGWGVEHVLQSRTLEFVDGVNEITGGKGVDIVLNSLSGDFIPASIDVLAPYGRFLELGKRDIYDDKRVGLKGFRRNISYFAVDLAAMVEEKPEYSAELFAEVVKAVVEGRWSALPVTAYPATEVSDALRYMAQGRHIGKLAIEFSGEAKKDWQALPKKAGLFSRDASYLITGGLGGVGSAVAEWMAVNGAGNIVLVSRRAAGAEELEVLRRVRAAGATVEHRRTDLVDADAVRALIAEIGAMMLPLKGIMHAAAVIDDALVVDLRPERFDAVYGPKIRGTWYLHEATLGVPLDFFLMFSSIAVPFPQLGHGSYSAANSFLDSFAAYRRGLGLPATSINWGGWRGLGLAKELGTSRTIGGYDAAGLGSFDRGEALHVLGEALKANPRQAVALSIDRDAIAASYEVIPTLLRGIVGADKTTVAATEKKSTELSVPDELAQMATVAERAQRLEELLRTETSRVLKLAPEKIKANQPFGQMGIDSLMALEFIRRVNAGLGLALPATAVFNYPTLTQLTAQVLKRLGLDAVPEPVAVPAAPKPVLAEAAAKSPDELSDEEALRALMEPGELSGD
jgi:NADPH:quinone reductase-like Zn-dependent oxidoreductase/acyl carrier protein